MHCLYRISIAITCVLGIACEQNASPTPPNAAIPSESNTMVLDTIPPSTNEIPPNIKSESQENFTNLYAWVEDYNNTKALANQILPPKDHQRIASASTTFAYWLRGLPLKPAGTAVKLYDGSSKPYQEGAYRVIDIDVGKRDLQQCADAVMRLRAEYLFANEDYDNIHFNYTSGHTIRFSDWAKGRKPKISGGKVSFSNSSSTSDRSYKNFKKYLTNVYCYAGTASLEKELVTKKVADIEPGDVFIWGGFPGHAILVVDVAAHTETNKKVFLLAQSYMPAQDIHILKNFNNTNLSPWYSEDFGNELLTPEWTFDRGTLKAFK